MLRDEWTAHVGDEPTDEEWFTINRVYMYHPVVSDVSGKDDLASIYQIGGYALIEELAPMAQQMELLCQKRDQAQKRVREYTEQIDVITEEYQH